MVRMLRVGLVGVAAVVVVAAGVVAPSAGAVGSVTPARSTVSTVGMWSQVASMGTARVGQRMILLPDGRVLAVGGYGVAGTALASAEIFDPVTRVWTPTGSMSTGRLSATATFLTDGRVLVAGGGGGSATAEVYDLATGRWTATGSMHEPRYQGSAIRLLDGDVLEVGGYNQNPLVSTAGAEIFHPATGTWTVVAPVPAPGSDRLLMLLPDGRVVAAGGVYSGGDASFTSLGDTEIYDPASNTWTTGTPMHTPRFVYDAAVVLPDGRLVVPGGATCGLYCPTNTVEAFSGSTLTWQRLAPMKVAVDTPIVGVAGAGDVLVAGGQTSITLNTAAVYDPATNAWTSTPTMPAAMDDGEAVRLTDGSVLVAGGWTGISAPASAIALVFSLTTASPPGVPTGVTATAAGRTARVGFTPPGSDGGAPIVGYRATCTSSGGGTSRTVTEPASPITVRGLTSGATYTCTVSASNAAGPGPDSPPSDPFTMPTVPGAPTAVVAAKAGSGTALKVSFTPPDSDGGSPLTGYRATCTSSTGGATRGGLAVTSPILVGQVTGQSSYTCRVRAINLVGTGPASITSDPVVTPAGLPAAPTAVTVTSAGTARAVLVAFTPPATDGGYPISGYIAECTSSTGGTTHNNVAAAPPVRIGGLTPGATYTCTAHAVNTAGSGPNATPSTPYTVP